MNRWLIRLAIVMVGVLVFPYRCPAPLIYRTGEGWTYESVGGAKWERARAKDQLDVAQQAFDKKEYGTTLKAARYVVKKWPFSDYAPKAQYLLGRCYEERKMDERAFKEYQKLLEKYPKVENFQEVLERQFIIANRFLGGQWFKLWGYIPVFPSMDKTCDMYEKIIKNGPFSAVGPPAQMSVGAAREKQKDYPKAVKAYEKAADRYHDQKKVASDAIYQAGLAYNKEAKTSEYDQSVAGKAIGTFADFAALYPDDGRVPETQKLIGSLRTEQARGSFQIARFYERYKRWNGALIYYNEVLLKDPNSPYADQAKKRIDALKGRASSSSTPK